MDTVSKKQRSRIMAKVKSKDSALEISFKKILQKIGYKFKKNAGNFFGKPDFVLPRSKIVIFIDSCFWHGCAKHCRMPSSRKKYWIKKIERNKKRDRQVNRHYKKIGWKVLRIWEHSFKNFKTLVKRVRSKLKNKLSK